MGGLAKVGAGRRMIGALLTGGPWGTLLQMEMAREATTGASRVRRAACRTPTVLKVVDSMMGWQIIMMEGGDGGEKGTQQKGGGKNVLEEGDGMERALRVLA